MLNDLAAIYLAKNSITEQSIYLIKALSTIDKALEADPKCKIVEIRFNRALLLQKLFLFPTANQAWQEYLQIDGSSAWADEARSYLAQMDMPSLSDIWAKEHLKLDESAIKEGVNSPTVKTIIEKFPHLARLYAIDELLPSWADNFLSSNTVLAKQKLQIAYVIGYVLADLHKDNFVFDQVKLINKLENPANNQNNLNKLAEAYQLYHQGKLLIDRSETDKAKVPFNKAKIIFRLLDDWASLSLTNLQLARCDMQKVEYSKAFEKLTQVKKIAEEYKYPYLLARRLLITCQLYLNQFELTKALKFGRIALKRLTLLKADSDILINHLLFARIFEQLKDTDEVLSHNYEALKYSYLYSKDKQDNRKFYALFVMASNLKNLQHSEVAFYFSYESVILATSLKINTLQITGLLGLSSILLDINAEKKATDEIKKIENLLKEINDKAFSNRARIELSILKGKYQIKNNPKEAIALYTTTLDNLSKTSDKLYLAQIYFSRALAHLSLNQINEAELDLENSLLAFEKNRNQVSEQSFRISFFENPLSVYDKMVQLQISQNHLDRAFDYSEKARARVLLDLLEDKRTTFAANKKKKDILIYKTSQPFSLSQIQALLPENTTIVEYSIFPSQLLIWVIQRNHYNFIKVDIMAENLQSMINKFSEAINRNSPKEELKVFSNPIYQAVFAPIAKFLDENTTLVIVPDKSLYSLPFAALIELTNEKYLIENRVLCYSPSATIFIKCLQRQFELSQQNNNSVLVVGNPKFNDKDFSKLSSLKGAMQEAREIASIYSNSQLLLENEATRENFLKFIPNSNIIHFAGHAIANNESLLDSMLVLATNPELEETDNGAIYAHQIYGQQFLKTQLIVLAACQTAKGKHYSGEGVMSIARPFLASGIPSVIASLWNADDSATKKLFIEFHKNLLAGKDSAKALQLAQIALINDSNSIYHNPKLWSLFTLLGSSNKINFHLKGEKNAKK